MRFRRRRKRHSGRHWAPPARIPDNDQVLHPGDRCSVEILRAIMDEPTQLLPTVTPLMTRGQRWRTRPGACVVSAPPEPEVSAEEIREAERSQWK